MAPYKSPGASISLLRFILGVAAVTVFVVTNPSNNLSNWIPDRYCHNSEKQAGFWSSFIRQQDTNYGVFSLLSTMDGISVTGLLHSAELCQFDSHDELLNFVCVWVGTF